MVSIHQQAARRGAAVVFTPEVPQGERRRSFSAEPACRRTPPLLRSAVTVLRLVMSFEPMLCDKMERDNRSVRARYVDMAVA